MRVFISILFISLFAGSSTFAQKSKKKKDKLEDGRPRIMQVYGDSLRTDSVVVYETVIGYVMPDFSSKFKGKWDIDIMKRQAKAEPDSLEDAYFEFNEDTLFSAKIGCNQFSGVYIIKGPTIKFFVTDTSSIECMGEVEQWFVKLIQERVSYFGIDEKVLFLKDVAYNIVFDCARKPEVKEPR